MRHEDLARFLLLSSAFGGQLFSANQYTDEASTLLSTITRVSGDDFYAGTVREAFEAPAATSLRLVDCIREIIERHRVEDSTAATGDPCRCGKKELSDHSRHLAQEIVARLGLQPERALDAKGEIRYLSAWFDDVLTKLEGAE